MALFFFYGGTDPTSAIRLLNCTVLTSAKGSQGCISLLFVLRLYRPYKCCSFVELYGADEYCSSQDCMSLLCVLRLCRR